MGWTNDQLFKLITQYPAKYLIQALDKGLPVNHYVIMSADRENVPLIALAAGWACLGHVQALAKRGAQNQAQALVYAASHQPYWSWDAEHRAVALYLAKHAPDNIINALDWLRVNHNSGHLVGFSGGSIAGGIAGVIAGRLIALAVETRLWCSVLPSMNAPRHQELKNWVTTIYLDDKTLQTNLSTLEKGWADDDLPRLVNMIEDPAALIAKNYQLQASLVKPHWQPLLHSIESLFSARPDYAKAVQLLNQCLKNYWAEPLAIAEYFMGCCYHTGRGKPQNYTFAVKHYKNSLDIAQQLSPSCLREPLQKHIEARLLEISASDDKDAFNQATLHLLSYYDGNDSATVVCEKLINIIKKQNPLHQQHIVYNHVRRQLIDCYLSLRRFDDAINILAQLSPAGRLEAWPDFYAKTLTTIKECIQDAEYQTAIDMLKKLRNKLPKDAETCHKNEIDSQLASCYLAIDEMEEALSAIHGCQDALILDFAKKVFTQTQALIESTQYAIAQSQLQTLTQLGYGPAFIAMGELLISHGVNGSDFHAAIAWWHRGLYATMEPKVDEIIVLLTEVVENPEYQATHKASAREGLAQAWHTKSLAHPHDKATQENVRAQIDTLAHQGSVNASLIKVKDVLSRTTKTVKGAKESAGLMFHASNKALARGIEEMKTLATSHATHFGVQVMLFQLCTFSIANVSSPKQRQCLHQQAINAAGKIVAMHSADPEHQQIQNRIFPFWQHEATEAKAYLMCVLAEKSSPVIGDDEKELAKQLLSDGRALDPMQLDQMLQSRSLATS